VVFEIAIGVCLGIIGAYALIRYWQVFWRVALGLAIICTVILIGLHVYDQYREHFSHQTSPVPFGFGRIVSALFLFVVCAGIPILAWGEIGERFPKLGAFIAGKPPWNERTHLALRVLVVTVAVVLGAGIFLCCIAGLIWLVDTLVPTLIG
jgi:hypothetical protein